jgi:hypothetical protein
MILYKILVNYRVINVIRDVLSTDMKEIDG